MSITATINGSSVSVKDSSFKATNQIQQRSTASFIVEDAGSNHYTNGMPVVVSDSILGTLFAGFIDSDDENNLLPNANNEITIQCKDYHYLADKRRVTSDYSNMLSGDITLDLLSNYLVTEGVTAPYAYRSDASQANWGQGTLSGTTATNNIAPGDLELTLAGSTATISCQSTNDWNNNGFGTNCNIANNQLGMQSWQTIKYAAYNVGNQGSTTYDYYQIWSGSFTVASGDTLNFTQWINGSSPQIMASLDAICSDGTYLRSFQSGGVYLTDFNGLKLDPATDLKGYADNQWYTRSFDLTNLAGKTINSVYLVFYGNSQGQYTAYFRDINFIDHVNGTTWIYQDGNGLNSSIQAHAIGYTNTSIGIVTAYTALATWKSNTTSVNSISATGIYKTSFAAYSANVASGTSLVVESSADGGSTWQTVTNNAALLGFVAGQTLSGLYLHYRFTMTITGNDPTVQALVNSAQFTIYPSYTATKNDVSLSVASTAFSTNGTLTNTSVQLIGAGSTYVPGSGSIPVDPSPFAASGLMLNGSWRSWVDENIANQTVYGTVSPSQATLLRTLQLTCGTGGELRSQFNFAGQWQNFTASIDIQIPAASTDHIGVVYRTTNWNNVNNTFAYVMEVTQTQLLLGRGSNTGSTNSYTNISTVSGLTLPANSWHTLTIIVNGNSHIVQLDGVQYISATDSTFPSAGYFGARGFNASGSTQTYSFKNFGVEASLTGTWQSNSLSLNSVGTVGDSLINVQNETLPPSTSYTIQTSIDGGSTWQTATSGSEIPGLTPGVSVVGKSLLVKFTLTSSNAAQTPILDAYSVYISSAYSSSGTRSTAPLFIDTMNRANVGSGFGTATNGQNYTQTGTGTTNLTSNEAQIINTTGDVHMQAGSTTGGDLDGTVRFSLSASTITAGMELRYGNATSFYRFSASTTTLTLLKKNVNLSFTLATASVALSTSTFYYMRFRVTGSRPVNLFARVWLATASEPTTWNLVATD